MKPDQTQDWDWAGMLSKMMAMCRGTDPEPAAPDEPGTLFGFSCCGEWSRTKPDQTQDWDWAGMLSKMMAMCSDTGPEQAAPEEPTTPDNIV